MKMTKRKEIKMINFNQQHIDVLKEVGNIGAGNAATALSTLLNKKIHMRIPAIKIVEFNELMEYVGGPEEEIVSVFLRIQGSLPGSMFFVLKPSQAQILANQLLPETEEDIRDNEMALSAIAEIGNILSGSYLSALSEFTLIPMFPSVPSLTIDMAGAILMQGLIEISKESDYAIVIDTMIEDERNSHHSIKGHFFLLPDPASFRTIFDALGVDDE